MRRVLATAALAIGLGSCGSEEDPFVPPVREPPSSPLVSSPVVQMEEIRYQPEAVRLRAGGTVTWVNRDIVEHTVTATPFGDPRFDSGDIEAEGRYRQRFERAGVFRYGCRLHPNMQGVVRVE